MIYTASRARIPERSALWREFRDNGYPIISTWIDEAGEGETKSFEELWYRIQIEIENCKVLVLYATKEDFPLKGALIEVGMALALNKQVFLIDTGIFEAPKSSKLLGTWINHPNVQIFNELLFAMDCAVIYCK